MTYTFTSNSPVNVETVAEVSLDDTVARQATEILTLKSHLASMTSNWERQRDRAYEFDKRINNVRGYLMDEYSMNGELSDDLEKVAEYLCIELTKRVVGSATIEISFSFEAPIDFDSDKINLDFDICESTYEVDKFDYTVDDVRTYCEEEN